MADYYAKLNFELDPTLITRDAYDVMCLLENALEAARG